MKILTKILERNLNFPWILGDMIWANCWENVLLGIPGIILEFKYSNEEILVRVLEEIGRERFEKPLALILNIFLENFLERNSKNIQEFLNAFTYESVGNFGYNFSRNSWWKCYRSSFKTFRQFLPWIYWFELLWTFEKKT